MKTITRIAATTTFVVAAAIASVANAASIADAIADSNRVDGNTERDGARHPDQVLAFIGSESGDVVLDWGAGGGYWSELFSGVVGEEGTVYAHQNAGERFESNKAALTEQFSAYGNIDLLPLERGASIPLDDNSVDTVMISYLYHHMHYADGSGESFPDSSVALFAEFSRILRPGGTVIIIEHAAVDGSSRTESGGWHRTPPETAKADMAGAGFEFAGEAPEIFHNPEDNLMNIWYETGLSGKTTTFVHKYRLPE